MADSKSKAPAPAKPKAKAEDVAAEICEDLQVILDRRSINAEMRQRVMQLQAKYAERC